MAEIDRLDRLVELARSEEPPPSDALSETMRRVRAAGETRPVAARPRWRPALVAVSASAAAAALVASLFLAGQPGSPAVAPAAPRESVEDAAQRPATLTPDESGCVVPALDILGNIESEVDRMMGSVAPRGASTVRT